MNKKIYMYIDWDEVFFEPCEAGYQFLGHTWLPDQGREVVDEELWMDINKQFFLWIDYINIVAMLYKRVDSVPDDIIWERLNKFGKQPEIYVSTDEKQRYIKVIMQGETLYFRKCIVADDFIEEGIPIECTDDDIRDLELEWKLESRG